MDLQSETGARAHWLAWPYGFATDELDSLSVRWDSGERSACIRTRSRTSDSTLQVGRFTLTAKSTLESHRRTSFPNDQ